jgi:hypothetical protein
MKDGRKYIDGSYDVKNAGSNLITLYDNYVYEAKIDKEKVLENIKLAEQGIELIKNSLDFKTTKEVKPTTEKKITNRPVEKKKSK